MSEYQHYEFQALDKPLTESDRTYLRSLSSRVALSATSAKFTYSYRDFPGDPAKLLDRCFDLMLYVANFGTRTLMVRFPKKLVDPATFAPYCVDGCIEVFTTAKSIILKLNFNAEDYYTWIDEDEEWLSGLVGLREALIQGDARLLYLAWLRSGFEEYAEADPEDMLEPPVPPNLQKLSPALQNFAELFLIDQDLIAAAAAESQVQKAIAEPIADWVAALPEAQRNQYLVRVAQGETSVGPELLQLLRKLNHSQPVGAFTATQRTLADLIELADQKEQQRLEQENAAAAKARRKHLEAIAPKADTLWQKVQRLVALKQATPYAEAVSILQDLRDLAVLQGAQDTFQQQLAQLKESYSTCSGLLKRMNSAGL
jgi:hypothetical protein